MLELYIDNTPDIDKICESNIKENVLKFIENIINHIIEFFRKIRAKLVSYRTNIRMSGFNKRADQLKPNASGSIELYIPNKNSIKLFLDTVYIDSYDHIPLKVFNMINNNTSIDRMKLEVFGTVDSDSYSDNNNYLYMIRDYLTKTFNSECNNKKDITEKLSDSFVTNRSIKYIDTKEFTAQFKYTKDLSRTRIGKEIKEIENTKQWIISYYTDITNRTLSKLNKLKRDVKRNKGIYNSEKYNILYRVLIHYSRMIRDANVFKALDRINAMQDEIYNKINSLFKE